MKKLVFLFILGFSMASYAQDLQLHYDLGHSRETSIPDRNYFTSTFEMFKPDSMGSFYWFIDMDYNNTKKQMSLAYLEISRNFKIGKFPLQPHIEYNGGLVLVSQNIGTSIANCLLLGFAYPFNVAKGNFELQLMYKSITNDQKADMQFTGVWSYPLFKGKVMFDGFFDIWTQDKNATGTTKKIIFLSEPQIWYNVNNHFSVGSETEISSNFVFGSNKVEYYPTVAVKWNF